MTHRTLFRALHVLWALPCVAVSVLLVLSKGGHPPGIVFVPLVLLAWGLGHLLLWGTHWLARKGLAKRGPSATWPVAVVLALVGSGVVAFLGILLGGAAAFERSHWSAWDVTLLGVVVAHLPAFAGLLLRERWSRLWAAALTAFWSLTMLYQMVDALRRGSSIDSWEWPVATLIVVGFGALAWALVRSPKVAGYFD